MANIFSGLKVVDLTKVFSGPFATRMLADYGAEVIKIESDQNYDDSRNYPPFKNDWSGYYEVLNRNKKGLSLNLKDDRDLEKFYTLIKSADIFVENLTPSTKFKLKIDYQTLKAFNPQLIYASLSGLGQDSDTKYYDVIAQAQSGLMALSGAPNQPMKIGPSVVDAFSGMTLAFAISSALFYRQKTGQGQFVEVAMLSCAMNLLESNLIEYSLTKTNPTPNGNHDNAISPFGMYKAQDGYIVIAAGNDSLWERLLGFLKQHSQIDDSLFESNTLRLKNDLALTEIIEQVFAKFSVFELVTELSRLKVPCSKVNQMSDVANDEDNFRRKALVQFKHSKLGDCIVPGQSIRFSESKDMHLKAAPEIGQDNDRSKL